MWVARLPSAPTLTLVRNVSMSIYSHNLDDDWTTELREWIKNNPIEIPNDAVWSYRGAIKGEKLHESTKQILRELNLGKKHTQESKDKISLALKGITTWNKGIPNSQIQKNKIANTLSKNWLVTFPDGKTEKVKNLKKFCKENNLYESCMYNVAKGKYKIHKGFTCQLVEDT